MSDKSYLKKRLAELEAQNNELRGLIFSTGALIVVLDRELNVMQFTKAAERIYELNDNTAGQSILSIKTKVADAQLQDDIERVFLHNQVAAVEVQSAEGRWYRRRILPFVMGYETIDEVLLVYDDITAIKAYQQDIEKREEKLRDVLDAVSDGIWIWNVKDGTTEVNARTAEIFGFTPVEPYPGTEELFGRIHEADLPSVKQAIQAHICGETSVYRKEFRIILSNGEERWVLGRGRILDYDKDGSPLRMVGTNTDVTERVETQEQLKQQADVLNQIIDMVTVTNLDGIIIYVNKAVCQILDYSPGELIGKHVSIYDGAGNGESQNSIVEAALKNGIWRGEVVNYTKTGREILIDSRIQVVRDARNDPVALCGVSTNITERRQAEKELLKMEKLQSVGLLAGGIAHDFNNILMGLFGNIEYARSQLEDNHPARDSLYEAEKSMERATNLTTRLLTFAKGGSPLFVDVDLEELTKDIVSFDLSGSNIRPVFDIADDLWFASVDKVQIQQVISNLTINAREAMPNAGCIYVSLRNVDVAEEHVNIRPGKYVELTVRDEGEGIDESVKEHIFDPYFTTKQAGSGLGLATVFSIVTRHGGTVRVNSAKGEGTEFVLLLPAVEHAKLRVGERERKRTSVDLQDARILVMDDEEMICTLLRKMLEKVVSKVFAVSDGKSAVCEYVSAMNAGEPYDAVVMDLTIKGGMGGKETVTKLLEKDPNARVIVSSGYADDAAMSEFDKYGFKGVVVKPYKKQFLIEILESVLAE